MPTRTRVLSDLHHEVRGSGPPVLFISGASGDAGHFHGREAILVAGTEAYALDYFGGLVKP